MLDIMRRRKGFIRVILGAVVISVAASFAFALYGIWGGALTHGEQGAPDWVASIDGDKIPTREYQQQRAMLAQQIRDRYQDQGLNEETMSNLVDQQALGLLLGTYLAQKEADRSSLRVTGPEISNAIVSSPNFQRDGRFVGMQQYRRALSAAGMTPSEFEQQIRQQLAADKLRIAVFSLARVENADLEKKYHDEVERVDVDYVLLADSAYADAKPPTDAELKAYFSGHATSYMSPESRRASYVLFDRESKAAAVTISADELKQAYDRDKATRYSHKEQRRASHILIKTAPGAAPEEDKAARAKVDALVARVRAGEDFAAVARQASEDPGSAPSGGDLGFFERGRMVKEFEAPAFSLSVGAVSDVIKSPFGYHVLKVTDSRPAGVQPFEEVRDEIRRTLSAQKAQEQIRKQADDFTARLARQEASFDKSAGEAALTVEDTGFFAKGEPAGKIGRLPQVDDAVFSLQTGGFTAPIAVPQGLAVLSLAEVRPPQPAPFDSVKSRVETDFKKSHSRDREKSVASEILGASGDLKARTAKLKLEVKSYPAVSRVQPLPPLTDASKAAALAASSGAVLGPFESEDGLVVMQVGAKKPATAEEAASERAALKRRLIDEDRSTLYQAFLARLQKNAKIDLNETLLQQFRPKG